MSALPWAVASGHAATTAAAVEVLATGGNAVDACVAAGFAASVAEPTLTSLGGGGFLLARTTAGEEVVFDFFVDTPGRGIADAPAVRDDLDFEEVVVRFSGADQGFHVGLASVAVPGCLAGWLHAHRRLGRLPLDEVVAPARRLAERGVEVNDQQAYLLRILEPILTRTAAAAALVAPGGRLLGVGDRYANPELAAFLERLDERGFAAPRLARRTAEAMARGGGLVTERDLLGYEVVERAPLEVRWRGHRLLTNPPPSFGGELVALGLLLLEERPGWPAEVGSVGNALALAEAMVATDDARAAGTVGAELRRRSTGGTTHVSIRDAEGNVAAMTTSNGEGSGWLLPGTGAMANNMMGEDDLHPEGFHAGPAGQRVASMMAPSVVVGPDGGSELVVGSGGSKRIRTALLQVLAGVIDQGRSAQEAVEAPRLHWDGSELHAEPGWSDEALAALGARWAVRAWAQRDLYFGGVHAVGPTTAAGDPRRGGVARQG